MSVFVLRAMYRVPSQRRCNACDADRMLLTSLCMSMPQGVSKIRMVQLPVNTDSCQNKETMTNLRVLRFRQKLD